MVDSCEADIVALTETWLNARIRDSELFSTSNSFSVYRCDRDGRQGGGTLLAVSKRVQSFCINIPARLESVWCYVLINNKKHVFGVCYRPPNADASFVDDLHDTINDIKARYPTSPITLLGDFNYPSIDWTFEPPRCTSYSSQCQAFLEVCALFNLTQMVANPTRVTTTSANILDLVLTTNPELINSISVLPGLSDHCVLHLYLDASIIRAHQT